MITLHEGQYLSDVMSEIPSDAYFPKEYPAVVLPLWSLKPKGTPLS
mgnify:CR=1 FL=1